MSYLASHFWAWGVSAFAVGLATALSVASRPERGPIAGWLVWFGLAFAAGLAAALLQVLPGRAGFWLESGLLLFFAFLLGAAIGARVGGHSWRDHEGWAIGLLPLALIWLGANVLALRSTERDLERRAASVVEKLGGDPAALEAAGRDLLLPRDAPRRAEAAEAIARLPGVRRVGALEAPAAAETGRKAEEPSGRAEAGPGRPAVPAPPPSPAPAEPEARPKEPPRIAAPEREGTAPPESEPGPDAAPGAIAPSGALDAQACQQAIAAALAREKIQFSSRGSGVRRASVRTLAEVIAYLRRCPDTEVEVRVASEGPSRPARERALERARSLVDYLAHMGVERGRLGVAGAGGAVSKDAPAAAGGVEFLLTPRR